MVRAFGQLEKSEWSLDWEMPEKAIGKASMRKNVGVARVSDWDRLGFVIIGTRHTRRNQGLELPRRMIEELSTREIAWERK